VTNIPSIRVPTPHDLWNASRIAYKALGEARKTLAKHPSTYSATAVQHALKRATEAMTKCRENIKLIWINPNDPTPSESVVKEWTLIDGGLK
jgi:hypothetical protein